LPLLLTEEKMLPSLLQSKTGSRRYVTTEEVRQRTRLQTHTLGYVVAQLLLLLMPYRFFVSHFGNKPGALRR